MSQLGVVTGMRSREPHTPLLKGRYPRRRSCIGESGRCTAPPLGYGHRARRWGCRDASLPDRIDNNPIRVFIFEMIYSSLISAS